MTMKAIEVLLKASHTTEVANVSTSNLHLTKDVDISHDTYLTTILSTLAEGITQVIADNNTTVRKRTKKGSISFYF